MQDSTALAQLKSAVAGDPGNADLLYLLGAELAQNGQYDGAVSALTSALAFNPQLHTARFQLGLLHLTMAQPEQSMAVLAVLDSLPEDNPLKHFKRGLKALASDDFDACIASLQRGIGLNTTNAALNKDMSMLIERIGEARSAAQPQPPKVEASARPDPPRRADLSLYKDIEDT